MPVLVIQLPPRPRDAPSRAGEVGYALTTDGVHATAHGRAAPGALPRADSVVAVLADADVSWHRITLPKAPAAKLRAALAGLLEDQLLDDDEALHLALAPDAAAGQEVWVAAANRPWLASWIAEFERIGQPIDRIVPPEAPGAAAHGHFWMPADDPEDAAPMLTLAGPDGVACLRAGGSLARSLLPEPGSARFTATPGAAAAAERWLDARVAVLGETERLLQATRGAWNLRQFDLAPRHRGVLALRDALRRIRRPEFRILRWGLVALVGLQLFGLNAHAWRERQAITAQRQAMTELLRSTHPGVRAVIDAPAQMERANGQLRAAAGRAGDGDLEVLLGAAAAAWPDGQGPVQTLRFEPGRLTLAAPGWQEAQIGQFRDRLRGSGFVVESADGRVTLSRRGAPA